MTSKHCLGTSTTEICFLPLNAEFPTTATQFLFCHSLINSFVHQRINMVARSVETLNKIVRVLLCSHGIYSSFECTEIPAALFAILHPSQFDDSIAREVRLT
jgi:hypothetical protein